MSNNRYEDVPFLSEEGGPSEKDDLPADLILHQRRHFCIHQATTAALFSLFLAVVLILTVVAVATQKNPANRRNAHSNPGQQVLEDLELPLEASLAPNKLNPDLYDFPRLGNVILKTPGCGTNPEEAKSLGCIFDPMNWHWTRPECFYEKGSEYAQAKGPWTYYRDSNFTEQLVLPDAHAMSTVRVMYTEHSWHLQHCVYALKSLHRAAMMDKWIPEEAASWPHSLHCMKVFEMMGTPAKTLNTRVDMQFLACVKFESNKD
ncbi:hypothetical protein B0J11DRAFT_516017 [Dendryphion nanum]|uniref:Uncharacterized protein n=1 Tax=Dendryphion nanum TaxID=256645 RepID=A0A9P9EGE7_9PLEO|nr:hypothetical protein B0J11DRAFT_516017 [Dendryphion nanum]